MRPPWLRAAKPGCRYPGNGWIVPCPLVRCQGEMCGCWVACRDGLSSCRGLASVVAIRLALGERPQVATVGGLGVGADGARVEVRPLAVMASSALFFAGPTSVASGRDLQAVVGRWAGMGYRPAVASLRWWRSGWPSGSCRRWRQSAGWVSAGWGAIVRPVVAPSLFFALSPLLIVGRAAKTFKRPLSG